MLNRKGFNFTNKRNTTEYFFKRIFNKIIQCVNILIGVEKTENQIKIITNYHFGKINHRGIIETYRIKKTILLAKNALRY